MSELIVPLTTVDEVHPHPNADRLDIARIRGWQCVVAKDSMKQGDLVVYVCPDALVPDEWAQKWGVAEYLGKDGRVRAVKLRGEPSFGFVVAVQDETEAALQAHLDTNTSDNVAHIFGLTKYVPPVRTPHGGTASGDSRADHPAFKKYTDIENMRHWPTLLDGLDVVVTEKIHGTNWRGGVIDGERMAGSHRVQRKHPDDVRKYEWEKWRKRHEANWLATLPAWKRWLHQRLGFFAPPPMTEVVNSNNPGSSVYWWPFEIPAVATMMDGLGANYKQVILYGEIYGPGIQKLGYGLAPGTRGFVAFDLMVDGKFLDYTGFMEACAMYGVPTLYRGPFGLDIVKAYSEGPTLLGGGPHMREGVVVKTLAEGHYKNGERLIQKLVSDSFLTDKHGAAEDLSNDQQEANDAATAA